MRRAILIAGPTAAGKSALALALAERFGAAIVNADSQQVFAGWRVLTARPGPDEEARAPHRLYGHRALDRPYSAGDWLRDLAPVLAELEAAGLRPILVGGTGLYFRAATEGLAAVPPVPVGVRLALESRLAHAGPAALAGELAARDPATAARTDLANPRRVLRALEVLEATGRGLAAWQAAGAAAALPLGRVLAFRLDPDRDWLHARIEARVDAMLAGGALEEAAAVRALGLPADAPGLRPVGAADLLAHLGGAIDLAMARARIAAATRQYAKRQLTWGRNQMSGWLALGGKDPARWLACATEWIEADDAV